MSEVLPKRWKEDPLGLVITATAIAAFTASNLYVFGLSLTLDQALETHFEVLDYVQITPSWALPAFLLYALFDITAALLSALDTKMTATADAVIAKTTAGRPRDPAAGLLTRIISPILWGFMILLRLLARIFLFVRWPVQKLSERIKGAEVCLFLLLLFVIGAIQSGIRKEPISIFSSIVFTVAIAKIVSLAVSRVLPQIKAESNPFAIDFSALEARYLRLCATATGVLSFVFFYGLLVAPKFILSDVNSKVSLVEEGPHVEGLEGHINSQPGSTTDVTFVRKQKDINGRVVFRLSHSLLLLTEDRGRQRLVVIPAEQIERTDIPGE